MKKIAVLTSGGDAPGMNAAIRAIVRTSLNNKIDIVETANIGAAQYPKYILQMTPPILSLI